MDRAGDRTALATGATSLEMIDYLSAEKTREVLRFLISHLAVSRPADPVVFLADLLHRAAQNREPLDESLSLFQTRHIEALFNAMDPFRKGVISFHQYHNGMGTMGLSEYDREPPTDADGNVSKDTFLQEA